MKTRIWLLVAAACVWSLGAYAQQTKKKVAPASATCDKKQCELTVVATACDAKGVTVEPAVLTMTKGNKDAELKWVLKDSPGFAFAAGGIYFKDEAKAKKDFIDRAKSTPTEFRIKNKNATKGTFKYGVKLTRDGKACPAFDPDIVNDP